MPNLNSLDLPLIVHTIEHLNTLDPEYFDLCKNEIYEFFSHLDDKTKIDVVNHLSDMLVKSLQCYDEGVSSNV